MPRSIRTFIEKLPWIHTAVGLFGNTLFFLGSLAFLSEATKRAGVWMFIVGSLAMLVGSIGDAVVKAANRSGHDDDHEDPDHDHRDQHDRGRDDDVLRDADRPLPRTRHRESVSS